MAVCGTKWFFGSSCSDPFRRRFYWPRSSHRTKMAFDCPSASSMTCTSLSCTSPTLPPLTPTSVHTSGFLTQRRPRLMSYLIHQPPRECTSNKAKSSAYESKPTIFTMTSPGPPKATEGVAVVREPKRAPYIITCSIAEQGLGPLAWWKSAQVVEEDGVVDAEMVMGD